MIYTICALSQENLSSGCAYIKGADQPVHLLGLISTFVICYIVANLVTCKISIVYRVSVSVAEQTSWILTLSESPKTGFVTSRPLIETLKFFQTQHNLRWVSARVSVWKDQQYDLSQLGVHEETIQNLLLLYSGCIYAGSC